MARPGVAVTPLWAWLKRLPLAQFGIYLVVGAMATAVDWGVFYLGTYHWGWHYQPAVVLSLTLSAAVHFTLNKIFTFRCTSRQILRQLGVYALLSALYTVLSMGSMFLLVDLAGIAPMFSKMATTLVMNLVSYLLNKFITFNRRLFPPSR